MVANQTTIVGPNTAPMSPVPRRWTRNSPTSRTTAIGTMNGVKAVVATRRPSTAESTEIAGVMTPSP